MHIYMHVCVHVKITQHLHQHRSLCSSTQLHLFITATQSHLYIQPQCLTYTHTHTLAYTPTHTHITGSIIKDLCRCRNLVKVSMRPLSIIFWLVRPQQRCHIMQRQLLRGARSLGNHSNINLKVISFCYFTTTNIMIKILLWPFNLMRIIIFYQLFITNNVNKIVLHGK